MCNNILVMLWGFSKTESVHASSYEQLRSKYLKKPEISPTWRRWTSVECVEVKPWSTMRRYFLSGSKMQMIEKRTIFEVWSNLGNVELTNVQKCKKENARLLEWPIQIRCSTDWPSNILQTCVLLDDLHIASWCEPEIITKK